ncbi:hypothetical protein OAF27_00015 [Verrucomicrobiales bacterium]|nr:hypothetical protein [Verrucomicrobiales bacterium]
MALVKKALVAGAGAMGLAAVGLVVVAQVAKKQLTPEALVKRMEAEWDCKASIGSSDPSFFGSTGVVIRELVILPRDAETPLAVGDTGVSCASAELRFRKFPLLSGKLEITGAEIDGVLVKTVLGKDGEHSLGRMFNEKQGVATGLVGFRKAVPVSSPPPEFPPFNAADLPIPATLAKASLTNARAEILLPWGGRFVADEIQLDAPEIDFDARDLARHNRALVDASLRLKLDVPPSDADPDTRPEVLNFGLTTNGEIVPFDSATGELRPDAAYDFTFLQGSSFTASPIVQGVADDLKDWKEAGELLETLAGRAELQQDTTVSLGFSEKGIRLSQPAALVMPAYTFALGEGSRIRPSDRDHDFLAAFTLSEDTTKKTEKAIKAVLRDKAGGTIADIAKGLVIDPMITEGRLTLEFESKGDLRKPKVSLKGPLGDVAALIEQATEKVLGKKAKGLGGILRGLLK